MKSLQEECLLVITKNLHNPRVGPFLWRLHRSLKSELLSCIIWHDALTLVTEPYVVTQAFFENLKRLNLPQNTVLNDKFMATVSASGCKFQAINLVVPLIKNDERLAPLSGKGIRALLANQNELESLKLVWCRNFKTEVITRVRSNFLHSVDIVGDAVCRCFDDNPVLRDKVHLCQRDFGFLAINNPTISKLCLDGVILDLNDCYNMFGALANSLQHLEIKIVRFYAFCQRNHCFYGRFFVPFLEFIDRVCHRLFYLSCFALQTDVQDQQLRMDSPSLKTLCLEGHVFQLPLLLPPNLEKLKISVNGCETVEHCYSLKSRARNLCKFYVNLVDNFTLVNEAGFLTLFQQFGPLISSVTNVSASNFRQVSSLLCEYCTNLRELSVIRCPVAGLQLVISNGNQLLPLFRDTQRASNFRHLHLGFENLSQSLLLAIAENCLNLKTLDLAYCRTLDDILLSKIAENCAKSLKILEISLCSGITDQGVIAVALKCWENLEEAMLFHTKIGDRAVLALAANCSNLRICGISPEQVSKKTGDILKEKCIQKILLT